MCPEPEAEAMYHSNKQVPYTPPPAPPWWSPTNIFFVYFSYADFQPSTPPGPKNNHLPWILYKIKGISQIGEQIVRLVAMVFQKMQQICAKKNAVYK